MRLMDLRADPDLPAPKGYEFVPLEEIRKRALPAAMNAAVRALESEE